MATKKPKMKQAEEDNVKEFYAKYIGLCLEHKLFIGSADPHSDDIFNFRGKYVVSWRLGPEEATNKTTFLAFIKKEILQSVEKIKKGESKNEPVRTRRKH